MTCSVTATRTRSTTSWTCTSRPTCCLTTSREHCITVYSLNICLFYKCIEFKTLNVAPCREYEFPAERLNLGILLGSGAFGRVLKAEASGIVSWEAATTVAVKMVKPQADISYIKVTIE